MNEVTQTGVEATLFGAVKDMQEVSYKLDNIVFGERDISGEAEKVPEAPDSVNRLIDLVQSITKRVRKSVDKLERIGK